VGADIKTLRTRIRSVDSTLHLTKAMGLVASSKIRRATERMLRGREYLQAVEQAISLVSSSPECRRSPYMQDRGIERTLLIVIAGDRGMAGGYNANVFRVLRDYTAADRICIGKRACERYHGRSRKEYLSSEHFSSGEAAALASELCDGFIRGEYDRLGIVCTDYVSLISQEATIRWVLPLSVAGSGAPTPVIFEPDELTVLNAAVPEYVAGCIMAAVRESFVCEVAARRTAMDSAGKNAQEMIDDLTLQYNRARQGAITQEITEIVAGSGV
jgi:F-type H+-transporting ATPase subunit gamma